MIAATKQRCNKCGSLEQKTVILPDSHIHYARLECAGCEKWVKWLPSPQTIQKRAIDMATIRLLAQVEDISLPDWDAQLIMSCIDRLKDDKSLTPNQAEQLSRIALDHGILPNPF